jgi:hypothetical protein
MKLSNYKQIFALILLIIVLISCCDQNKKKVISIESLFDNSNINSDYLVSEDITALEIYNQLKKNCDDNFVDYSGNLYILYDYCEERITFNRTNDVITVELKGFLCPYSTKDIFYNELNIFLLQNNLFIDNYPVHSDTLTELVSKFISSSINNPFNYPYIVQIIVDDNISVSQLSIFIGLIIDGYQRFVQTEVQTKGLNDIIEKYPFRLKIIPSSKFGVSTPSSPPIDRN